MKLSEELQWRGFVNQTTLDDLAELDDQTRTFYFGVDPSADSMQIGNLAAAMMCKVFIKHGYKAIMLVGGATGIIGDPDGKKQERDTKSLEEVNHNKQAIAAQYDQVFGDGTFKLVDNHDWFKDINYLEFLRDVGKHVPMRTMVNREFVQARLSEGGAGISYAEFSYSLIQGYDFVHLFREHNVTLQVAGADQWGNSIAGVDLVRRMEGAEAHVYTVPLVINKATGRKFGKSEDGAVWLDEAKTSVYRFYQFWLNVDDEGVEDYLKVYTELSKEQVDEVVAGFKENPAARLAQKTLAYEVTKIVHGQDKADKIVKVTAALFGETSFLELDDAEKSMLSEEFAVVTVSDDLYQMLVDSGLASSKSEARNFHSSGAISVNEQKVLPDQPIAWNEGLNLIKRGKNKFALVKN